MKRILVSVCLLLSLCGVASAQWSPFATQAWVHNELAGYTSTEGMSVMLEPYAKTVDVASTYATQASLAAYPTTAEVQAMCVAPSGLAEALAPYATTAAVAEAIAAIPATPSDGWQTVLLEDFTQEPAQVLASDGQYTLSGRTWTKVRSIAERAPMEITSAGLVIRPNAAGNYNQITRTTPALSIPLADLAAISYWSSVRVWVNVASDNVTASWDSAIAGIDSGSLNSMWLMYRGFWNQPLLVLEHVSAGSYWATARSLPLANTNRVLAMQLDQLGGASGQLMFGAYAEGFPPASALKPCCMVVDDLAGGRSNTPSLPDNIHDLSLVLSAARAGSPTPLDVTIAQVRVDVKLN